MKTMTRPVPAPKPVAEHEQKQVALAYLREAWAEARLDGVEDDCLAQACLFTSLAELVTTYGEDAAATASFPSTWRGNRCGAAIIARRSKRLSLAGRAAGGLQWRAHGFAPHPG